MSAITKFFFRAPYAHPGTWAVIRWWESRRLAYNVAVGAAGLLSLGVLTVAGLLPPGPRAPGIPLGLILIYGFLANCFFCLGPALDALICRRWGPNLAAVGPALFRYGFAFAVGLTLLPIPLALIGWGIRLLHVLW
jgi:hypothetical protein